MRARVKVRVRVGVRVRARVKVRVRIIWSMMPAEATRRHILGAKVCGARCGPGGGRAWGGGGAQAAHVHGEGLTGGWGS